MFEMPMPGVFLVRYRDAREMEPEHQGVLVDAIRSTSLARQVTLVFVIADGVRGVDFTVPTFWIKMVTDHRMRIGAMAMVTDSLAVEIAAKSFGAATRFRTAPVDVRTFRDEGQALRWVRELAAEGRPAPTPA